MEYLVKDSDASLSFSSMSRKSKTNRINVGEKTEGNYQTPGSYQTPVVLGAIKNTDVPAQTTAP
jgi:hypothetical protein